MASELLEDPRVRIESAADKHGQFLREVDRFVYRYVKGTLRGFDARDATQFKLQLRKQLQESRDETFVPFVVMQLCIGSGTQP